jgi:hypothetical protein
MKMNVIIISAVVPRKQPPPSVPNTACDPCGGSPGTPVGDMLRCTCGSLLARYVEGRIELKCRRCKRTLIVPATSVWEDES